MDSVLVSIPDAAKALAVSTRQIHRWAADGRLERKTLARRCVRITTRSIRKLVERAPA